MENKTVVSYLNEAINPEMITRYPDMEIAVEYLLLKDSTPKLSMEEIADMLSRKFSFPPTRQSLYNRLEAWRQNGTLRQAEQVYLTPKIEEMRSALGRAITALPDILDRLVDEAKNGKSGKNALDITVYLMGLVQGELTKVAEPGDQERAYVRSNRSFSPLDIVED